MRGLVLLLPLLVACTGGASADDDDDGGTDGGDMDGGADGGDAGGTDTGPCDNTTVQVPQNLRPEDGISVGSAVDLVVTHDADYHEVLSFTVMGPQGGVVASTDSYTPEPGATESLWPIADLEPGLHGWFTAGRHDGCWSIGSPTWYFTVE